MKHQIPLFDECQWKLLRYRQDEFNDEGEGEPVLVLVQPDGFFSMISFLTMEEVFALMTQMRTYLEEVKAPPLDAAEIEGHIRQFLEDHPDIMLHPGRNPEEWSKQVVAKEGCPCVPGRFNCPCDQPLADIEELNHCRCYLFVNEEYMNIYNDALHKN